VIALRFITARMLRDLAATVRKGFRIASHKIKPHRTLVSHGRTKKGHKNYDSTGWRGYLSSAGESQNALLRKRLPRDTIPEAPLAHFLNYVIPKAI
jgi:protoheme ferro-lyase